MICIRIQTVCYGQTENLGSQGSDRKTVEVPSDKPKKVLLSDDLEREREINLQLREYAQLQIDYKSLTDVYARRQGQNEDFQRWAIEASKMPLFDRLFRYKRKYAEQLNKLSTQ